MFYLNDQKISKETTHNLIIHLLMCLAEKRIEPEVIKEILDNEHIEYNWKEDESFEDITERLALKRITQWKYWSKIRAAVLKRDNWTCQQCKTKLKKFDIHHIVKQRLGGSDAIDNLMTVCRKCHYILDRKEYGLSTHQKS